jgi:hypothetical protein
MLQMLLVVCAGDRHWSHWSDVLLLLPVLMHCTAISGGTLDALVGVGLAPAASLRKTAATPALNNMLAGSSSSTSSSIMFAARGVLLMRQPMDLHKLVVRAAAAYMFVAALLGQAVKWLAVVAVVACLMLGGQVAVDCWHWLHVWWYRKCEPDFRPLKQKGT